MPSMSPCHRQKMQWLCAERLGRLTLEVERGIARQDRLGRLASKQREQAQIQLDSSVSTQRGNKTELQADWVARAGLNRKWVNWWVHLWCRLFKNRGRAPADGWRGLSKQPGSCGDRKGLVLRAGRGAEPLRLLSDWGTQTTSGSNFKRIHLNI